MHHEAWLKDLLVFLVAAGLIAPLFHRARVGAVLGFLLIGVAVGPYGFGALAADFPVAALSHHRGSRPRRAVRGTRRHVPVVPDRHRDVGRAAVVAAPLRGRHRQRAVPAVGGGVRDGAVADRGASKRGHHPRPRPRDVVDRGGHAASGGAGPHRHAAGAGRDRGAAVPGPHGGAGPVRRRNPRPRRQCRDRAWLGGADGGGRDRRDPDRRTFPAAAVVQRRRSDRQPRADHGDDAVAGDRRRRADRLCRALDRARRLPRRRAAVGNRIPPPGRDRRRAVQRPADRPVFHHRRHVDRRAHGLGRHRHHPAGGRCLCSWSKPRSCTPPVVCSAWRGA